MHPRDGTVYHRIIQIGEFFSLVLFFNNHVMLVKELKAVIFECVHSFTVLCGMQSGHTGFHKSLFVCVV